MVDIIQNPIYNLGNLKGFQKGGRDELDGQDGRDGRNPIVSIRDIYYT